MTILILLGNTSDHLELPINIFLQLPVVCPGLSCPVNGAYHSIIV